MHKTYDVAIIGGGLVGLSLSLALAQAGLSSLLVEARDLKKAQLGGEDLRTLVLSHASCQFLTALDIFSQIKAFVTPVEHIFVTEFGHIPQAKLSASEQGLPALGHVVALPALLSALRYAVFDNKLITVISPGKLVHVQKQEDAVDLQVELENQSAHYRAKLLVGADGTHSKLREFFKIQTEQHDYQQTALLCKVTLEKPHTNTALECFTKEGPLALLPFIKQQLGVVWVTHKDNIDKRLALSDTDFIEALHKKVGYRFGIFSGVTQRTTYPLIRQNAKLLVKNRFVLLGNAANTLHPVAGQGFNLGVRDIAILADILHQAKQASLDVGEAFLLQRFVALRKSDHQFITRFTDTLAKLFVSQNPLVASLRNLSLLNVALQAPLRKKLLSRTVGHINNSPPLLRGVPFNA